MLFAPTARVILVVSVSAGAAIGAWGWCWPPTWVSDYPFRLNLATAVVGFLIGVPIALIVINTVVMDSQERAETLRRSGRLRATFKRLRSTAEELHESNCLRLVRDAADDEDLLTGSLERIGRPAPFTRPEVSMLWEVHARELKDVQHDWKTELDRFVRATYGAGQNASAYSVSGEALTDDIRRLIAAVDRFQQSLTCTVWISGVYPHTYQSGPGLDDYGEYEEEGIHGETVETSSLFGLEPSERERSDRESGREWVAASDPTENTERSIEDALRKLGEAATGLRDASDAVGARWRAVRKASEWKQVVGG